MHDHRFVNKKINGGGGGPLLSANGATAGGERERERVAKGSWRVVTRARIANRGGCSGSPECTVVKHVRAWFAVPAT